MDLRVYCLPNLTKEKRERQPNWTEPEKNLLLSLTRMHQAILENKGSDTSTIKRKSQAWDEIALHMNAAGYHRSKERLKQQLGRIRAARAKKAKEALEKIGLNTSSDTCMNRYAENHTFMKNHGSFYGTEEPRPSLEGAEEVDIKAEQMTSISEQDYHNYNEKPVDVSYGSNAGTMGESALRFILENVHSLREIENVPNKIIPKHANSKTMPTKENCAFGLSVATNTNSLPITDSNASPKKDPVNTQSLSSIATVLRKNKTNRLSDGCTPLTKEQRLSQLHTYRIAVERERLRSLKLQQVRDRILHRKDLQIQNLKLKILRNLTNQNRDGNHINV